MNRETNQPAGVDRRRVTLVLRAMAAVCVMVAAGLAVVAPAGAEPPDQIGFWNRLKPDLPPDLGNPLPPPPDVPQDGFLVANDSSGPQAIAALRFNANRAQETILVVSSHDGSSLAGTDIVACPITGEWDQQFDGKWSDRPDLLCVATAEKGILSSDETTLTFRLGPEFFRDRVLVDYIEIGLSPAEGANLPFRAIFGNPGSNGLTGVDGPLFAPPTLPPTTRAPATTAPPPTVASTLPPQTFAVTPDTGFFGGTTDTSAAPTTSIDFVTTTVLPSDEQAFTNAAAAIPSDGSDRLLAIILLLLTAAGLFMVSNQTAPTPRLLGGTARMRGEAGAVDTAAPEEPVGGVGKFKRARSGMPTKRR